jgi:regulatory protein
MAWGKRSFGSKKSRDNTQRCSGSGFGRKRRDLDAPAPSVSDGLAIAGRLLGLREHTEGELIRKLKEKGFDEAGIAETMAKLAEFNFLDDERVGKNMAASLVRQGWGPSQVRFKLKERHLSDAHVDAAMEQWEGEEVWVEAARSRIESKFRKEPGELDQDERHKAFRYLQYRGYSGSVARAVLFERDR